MGRVGIAVIAVATLLAGCAGRGVPATLDPAAADRAVRETAPDRPLRVVFEWRILDGEARFSGDGVARIEAPYRARLDLFGPQGEGYLSAALVGTDLRLSGEPDRALPPPAMIWSVLGVVKPPEDAQLVGTRQDGDALELHYAVGESRLLYILRDLRLRLVEWRGAGRHMVVELDGAANGVPATAAYRDWSGGTELHTGVETVEEVESYPSEIWTPGY